MSLASGGTLGQTAQGEFGTGGYGSFMVDARGAVLAVDPVLERLTGRAAAEILGHRVGREHPLAQEAPAHSGLVRPFYEGAIPAGPETERLELRLHCAADWVADVEAVATRRAHGGDLVKITVVRILSRSRLPAEDLGCGPADPLTDLPGWDAFLERLTRELRPERAGARPIALIVADVDHLRRVNDQFGREEGDTVLRKLAGILRATVREEDFVARLHDDDFAILLPGASRGEARQLAGRLRSTVERFRFLGPRHQDEPLRITLSLGAASFPADADSPEGLVERAREALGEAREMGRNRAWCYVRRRRLPLQVPVYLDGSDPLFLGFSVNLSPSGLFVQTPDPLEPGMRCALAFKLPRGGEGNVHAIGRVARVAGSPIGPPIGAIIASGMGIEFERFGPGDRQAIESFLHQNEALIEQAEVESLAARRA